jgi:large subunit ribosomal protein L18
MKRKIRRKKRILGTSERPRLVVYRSLKHIYGQIVDDSVQKTLVGASSKNEEIIKEIKKPKPKKEVSSMVGKLLAEKAKQKNIKKIVFDRNGYAYHGRVKALAEAAREAGLEF